MNCWKCAKLISDAPVKIGFRALCPHCGIDLHTCLGCSYYAPGKPNDCAVPGTEYVRDRESSNFCEEFRVKTDPSSKRLEPNRFDSLFKKLIVLFLTLAGSASAITKLPDEFHVEERFLAWSSTFDAATETGPFATARKRVLSLSATFDLEDMDQRLLATATARFLSWGTSADVKDPEGRPIGSIEEELFRILPWAEYKVFNGSRQLTAIAKMDLWGTEFTLAHPDHPEAVYATISRPFLRFYRDSWTVKIFNASIFEEKIIDPRLLLILAIYQTDKDHRDRLRKELLDQIKKEIDSNELKRF